MNTTTNIETLDLFRELIYDRIGIHLSKEKDYILEAKLNKILFNKHYPDLLTFYNSLLNGSKEAIEVLVRYITTTHTFFFREKEHLDILVNLARIRRSETTLIWSAGCSTGEEVYSIIIQMLETGIQNFIIVASDINTEVLYHLKRGIYHPNRLQYMDLHLKQKYFRLMPDGNYKIMPELKKYFVIKKINLIEQNLFEQKVDFILCRNVMIYFDVDTRKKVLSNLLDNLRDDGYLFIGQSENLFNITDRLESVFVSVYSKK